MKEIAKQRKTLFLWAPIFLGIGIIAYFTLNFSVEWYNLLSVIGILFVILSWAYKGYTKLGSTKWLIYLLLTIMLLLTIFGYCFAKIRTDSLNTPMITEDLFPAIIEGEIEKLVQLEGGKAKRVILGQVDVNSYKNLRVRLKTYHFKGDDWQIGDKVSVKAKLMAPSGPVMPGGFDFSHKAYYERLSAVGYTMGEAILISNATGDINHIESIRAVIGDRLYQNMDARNAGIAQALLTGERAGITKIDAENLRSSGLAHLLAISGLHIGLVAGCVFFFIRLSLSCVPNLALYYPIKKWAAVCAIIIAFSYMVLAGATVPTIRAFIMTSLVLLAIILDRSAMNMRLVALAALFVMVTTPETIMGPSFILSFSAVSALIIFYRDVGRRWLVNANAFKPFWRPFYYLFGIILTSLIATIATAPFSIMFFNKFAVYSVLSNILAMPLMAFIIMPLGLLCILLMPLELDSHFWFILDWGIANILLIAESITAYVYSTFYVASFDMLTTILVCSGFIFLILWNGYLRFIGLILVVISLSITINNTSKIIEISEDMKGILYVDKFEDNIFLIGNINSYTKSNWLNSHGYNEAVDIGIYNNGDNLYATNGHCDDFMCRITYKDIIVSIVHNPLIINNLCREKSTIIISDIPIDEDYCSDIKIIDRFDIWRWGATSILLKNNDYKIRTVK